MLTMINVLTNCHTQSYWLHSLCCTLHPHDFESERVVYCHSLALESQLSCKVIKNRKMSLPFTFILSIPEIFTSLCSSFWRQRECDTREKPGSTYGNELFWHARRRPVFLPPHKCASASIPFLLGGSCPSLEFRLIGCSATSALWVWQKL